MNSNNDNFSKDDNVWQTFAKILNDKQVDIYEDLSKHTTEKNKKEYFNNMEKEKK